MAKFLKKLSFGTKDRASSLVEEPNRKAASCVEASDESTPHQESSKNVLKKARQSDIGNISSSHAASSRGDRSLSPLRPQSTGPARSRGDKSPTGSGGGGEGSTSSAAAHRGSRSPLKPSPALSTPNPEDNDVHIDFVTPRGKTYTLKVPSGTSMARVMNQFAAIFGLKCGAFDMEIDGKKLSGNESIDDFQGMALDDISVTMKTDD